MIPSNLAPPAYDALAPDDLVAIVPDDTFLIVVTKPNENKEYVTTVGALLNASTVHALPAGPPLASVDEVDVWSIGAGGDTKSTVGQLSQFGQSNFQSWTTGGRPALTGGQVALGYNTQLSQFEFCVAGGNWTGLATK